MEDMGVALYNKGNQMIELGPMNAYRGTLLSAR